MAERDAFPIAPIEGDWYMNWRYPRWRCPDCGTFNRILDTFGEVCTMCRADHTLDWQKWMIDPLARRRRMSRGWKVAIWGIVVTAFAGILIAKGFGLW